MTRMLGSAYWELGDLAQAEEFLDQADKMNDGENAIGTVWLARTFIDRRKARGCQRLP